MKGLLKLWCFSPPDRLVPFWKSIDWAIIALYLASHFWYTRVLHAVIIGMPVQYFMQYLDPHLLRTDLWRSLLYLHAQPPLMNMIVGFLLQGNFDLAMGRFYFFAGLVTVYCTNAAFAELGIRRSLRIAVIAWLCFFPTFTLFGRWAYTPHIELALCSVILYVLARMQHEAQITCGSVLKLGISFCLLGLLRSQWHPVIFVVWIALIWWLRRRDTSVMGCIKGTVVAMSPLVLLFLKNFVLFGVLGASSWSGMNFSGSASNSINTAQLRHLKDSGQVSRDFPVYFRRPKAIAVYLQWEKEGRALPRSAQPSMKAMKSNGFENYNFQAYIEGSKQDMADSMAIVRHYPWQYVSHVFDKMLFITTVPSISYQCCNFTLRNIRKWDRPYGDTDPNIRYLVSRGSAVLYGVIPIVLFFGALWPRGALAQQRFFILAGLFLVMSSYVVSCATSNLEQERIRWALVTFYLAYVAMLAETIIRKFEKKKD